MSEFDEQPEPPVDEAPEVVIGDHTVDPAVVAAVRGVANRFGGAGLEDMIELGRRELAAAEEALKDLGPGA